MQNSNFQNNFSNFNQNAMWEMSSRQEEFFQNQSGSSSSGGSRRMSDMNIGSPKGGGSVFDMYSNMSKKSSFKDNDLPQLQLPNLMSNMAQMGGSGMVGGDLFNSNMGNFPMGSNQTMFSGIPMMGNQMMPGNQMNQNMPGMAVPANLSALSFGMNQNNVGNAGMMNPAMPNLQMLSNTMSGGGNVPPPPWIGGMNAGPPSPQPLMADASWQRNPTQEKDLREELNRVRKQKSPGSARFQSPPRRRSPQFPTRTRGGKSASRFGPRTADKWSSPGNVRSQSSADRKRPSVPNPQQSRPSQKRARTQPNKGSKRPPPIRRDNRTSKGPANLGDTKKELDSSKRDRGSANTKSKPEVKRPPSKEIDVIVIPDNDSDRDSNKADENEEPMQKDKLEEEVKETCAVDGPRKEKSFLLDDGDDDNFYGIKPTQKSDDDISTDEEDPGSGKSDIEDELTSKEDHLDNLNLSSRNQSKSQSQDRKNETSEMDDILEDRLLWDSDDLAEEKEEREWYKEKNSSSKTRVKPSEKKMSTGGGTSENNSKTSEVQAESSRPKIKAPSSSSKASMNEDPKEAPKEKEDLEAKWADVEFNKNVEMLIEEDKIGMKTIIASLINTPLAKTLPSNLDYLNWAKKNYNPLKICICPKSSSNLDYINMSQMKFVTEELLSKMRQVQIDLFAPQFISCKRKRGCLYLGCSTIETLTWLKRACKEMENDIKLAVVDSAEREGKQIAVLLTVPGHFKFAEVDEILARIEEQNPNVYPSCWVFLGRRKFIDKQCIAVAVGEMSARTILQNQMTLFLGLWTISAKIINVIEEPSFKNFRSHIQQPPRPAEETEDFTKDDYC